MVDPVVRRLFTLCQFVPVGTDGAFVDSWTQREWSFAADRLTDDWQRPLSVLAELTAP